MSPLTELGYPHSREKRRYPQLKPCVNSDYEAGDVTTTQSPIPPSSSLADTDIRQALITQSPRNAETTAHV